MVPTGPQGAFLISLVASVGLTSFSRPSADCPPPKPAQGHCDADREDDPVKRDNDIMKGRHPALEGLEQSRDNDDAEPGVEKGTEASSVKELSPIPSNLRIVVLA